MLIEKLEKIEIFAKKFKKKWKKAGKV